MLFNKGDKLDLITRHQDKKHFSPIGALGVVEKSSEEKLERMKVRVFRADWRPDKGYLHELLRVSDTIWLERIGERQNTDGSTNLPHVHQILGKLTDAEFETR